MRRRFIVEAIANPERHPMVFISVIVLALGIATNGLSNLVLDVAGTWVEARFGIAKSIWQLGVVLFVVGAVVIGVANLSRWLQPFLPQNVPSTAKVLPMQQTFPGLIVFMSLGPAPPAKVAILHHWKEGQGDLRQCWLICGGSEALLRTEKMVQELVVEHGIPRSLFHFGESYRFADPENSRQPLTLVPSLELANDPNHIRKLVDGIYEDALRMYQLEESEIVADYTGGTKSMTAGLILACAMPHRRLQYILSQYDEQNCPVNSQVMEVEISYRLRPVSARSKR